MDRIKVCSKCGAGESKHVYNEAESKMQCSECGSFEIVQAEGY